MCVIGCGPIGDGASIPNIVGGVAARGDDPVARTTVALVKGRRSFCTGVVIAPRFVLTAAHCLERVATGNFRVYFGLRARLVALDDALLIDVEEMRQHENYRLDEAALDAATAFAVEPVNDIALIELTRDALATPAVFVPATAIVRAGDPIVIAGFGKTAAVDGTSGELRLVETAFGAELPPSKEVEIQRGPRNSCDGDSGGPLFLKKGRALALLGILSRGDEECRSIGVYTDVRQFQDWIAASMNAMAMHQVEAAAPTAPKTPHESGPFVPPVL